MSENTAARTAEVTAERERIVAAALSWAQGNGYGYGVRGALEAIGLGEHLPRTTARVQVSVVGTVDVPCDPAGNWTQDAALIALRDATWQGRTDYEAHEVPDAEPTVVPAAA